MAQQRSRPRTARQAFRTAMGRDPGRVHGFRQPLTKQTTSPKPLDRAALFHYWHPDRDGVEHAPERIKARIDEIAGLDERGRSKAMVVRPPANAPVRARCWLVFKRNPEITHELSPGWFLVLAWHDGDEPIPKPLDVDDPRLLANLYLQSVKAGREVMGRDFDSAVQYFDHCMRVMDRDKEKQNKANDEYRDDRAHDYFDYTKIKNIGHGSKFALHHDGTIMPTRNEANWIRERGLDLPAAVIQRDREDLRKAKGQAAVQVGSRQAVEAQREMAHIMDAIRRRQSRVSVGIELPQRSPLER